MAEMSVVKKRRLVNPGKRRRRKMSAAQIKFFGTKRQRAALKARRSNPKRRRTFKAVVKRHRKRNVGHILTVFPALGNPGRRIKRSRLSGITRRARQIKKALGASLVGSYSHKRNKGKKIVIINKGGSTMARRKRRVNRAHRRRRNYGTKVRHNPFFSRRRRRHNASHRRYYRRNPGLMSGTSGKVLGALGGMVVTNFATGLIGGMLPSSLTSGFMGGLVMAVVAVVQGKLVGKVAKNSAMGDDFMVGGLVYAAAQMLNAILPSAASYTGISGLRGMGLIGGSSFYLPQVNQPGNMGAFQVPQQVTNALAMAVPAATANAGMGRLRRTGRLM